MVQFDPPLGTAVAVAVPQALLGSCIRLYAALSREEHESMRCEGTKVQVWSDWGGAEWSELSFREAGENTGAVRDGVRREAVDAGGEDADAPSRSGDMVTLVATAPLPPLVGRTLQFTYRMLHASGVVSWLGSADTNGSISIAQQAPAPAPSPDAECIHPGDWREAAPGVFLWDGAVGSAPVVAAALGGGADWIGWALGKEGPSRFMTVSSSITKRVALALLPTARPGAYVVYAPVLYHTNGSATLSLTDDGDVLFHPGAGDRGAVLYASFAPGTWVDAIRDRVTTVDIPSQDFLGISVKQDHIVRRLHILPITGRQASVALTAASFEALTLPCSDVAVLIDPASSSAAQFFAIPSPPDDGGVHISVGPAGAEMLVLAAYVLRDEEKEWSVACLPRGTGRVTAAFVDAAHPKDVPPFPPGADPTPSAEERSRRGDAPDSLQKRAAASLETPALLLVLHILRFFMRLVFAFASPSSIREFPKSERRPVAISRTVDNGAVLGQRPVPRAVFEVTGNFTVVVMGEVSKVCLSVDENILEPTPKDMGKQVWMLEGSVASENPQLLEVSLHA